MPFQELGQLLPNPLGGLSPPSRAREWNVYTPELTASSTDPTLGTGSTQQGRYMITEQGLVVYRFFFQFGSSGVSGGSGEYRISAPVEFSASDPTNAYVSVGQATLFDWSVSGHKELAHVHTGSGSDYFVMYVDDATVWHNNPFTWAADDRFGGTIVYEAVR